MHLSRKFLDEMDTIHLRPDEIELTKVPSEEEFRKACHDDIASFFMAACEAINPDMAKDFRREQEEQEQQKVILQEALISLKGLLSAHFAYNGERRKNGRDQTETLTP